MIAYIPRDMQIFKGDFVKISIEIYRMQGTNIEDESFQNVWIFADQKYICS